MSDEILRFGGGVLAVVAGIYLMSNTPKSTVEQPVNVAVATSYVDSVSPVALPMDRQSCEQTIDSLKGVLKRFRPEDFNPEIVRQHALQFDKEIFKNKINTYVNQWLK